MFLGQIWASYGDLAKDDSECKENIPKRSNNQDNRLFGNYFIHNLLRLSGFFVEITAPYTPGN